ncbi:hypothetical protein LTR08_002756 [Meristemomyces frigidus]|nr:hypothetical protein LTR08_002756 [Meristemomyces frigidus]
MKEIIVHPLPILITELVDSPIPAPHADDIVIKVAVAGSNVKDWAHITAMKLSINSGDDTAGIVYALGKDAAKTGEFHIGDRVAAFHPMLTAGGAYAEYVVALAHTLFKLPVATSFEASSALGCFVIKLAKASNIHPIIAICGGTTQHVSSLLDRAQGDSIVDYRQGTEAMKESVSKILRDLKAAHALDCISAKGTWVPLAQMLELGGQVSVVSGANAYDEPEIPRNVAIKYTYVGAAHSGGYKPSMPKQPSDKALVGSAPEFAFVFFRYIARMLAQGKFEGHPYEVVPGGLNGVKVGL